MCRLLAYLGTPLFLEDLLIRPEGSLVSQSLKAREARTVVNGDGCGLGWYGERPEPGLYRGVLPAWSDANLASLCRQIRSGLFLAHVRAATSGGVSTANCHPFALGSRLFMHNGQIGDYARVRRQVEGMIPDDAYAARTGTCDSEALFLAALAHGLDNDPAGAFSRTLAAIEALKGPDAEPTRFAAVHTDGHRLFAFRWASDGQPPSLYSRYDAGGVMIASEPCGSEPDAWVAMPSGSVLEAGPGGAWLRAFDVATSTPGARRAA
jgi:glutamine amidotransferase